MKPVETPQPFEPLLKAGEKWAQDVAFASVKDEVKRDLKGLYVAGTVLWQAKRHEMLGVLEAGGGVERVSRASSFGDGLNYVELKNGEIVLASSFLKAPVLPINSWDKTTSAIQTPFVQSHDLQVAFGGSLLGGKMERSDWSINEQSLSGVSLEQIIHDDAFFPEEFGVIENVTTTLAAEEDSEPEHKTNSAHYSLFGRIWASNLLGEQPMPNPYQDPLGYRQWALRGNTQIELFLQAPVMEPGNERPTTTTVINQHGCFIPDGETAITSLNRFRSLLAYYATRQYPDLFPTNDQEKFGYLVEPQAELES